MSGVVVAMRRTLLSCTSLARNGLITLGAATLLSVTPACAEDAAPLQGLLEFNRQEFAVLTTALALLGFSVVAAILLMRTRLRAAKNETRLRSDVQALQTDAGLEATTTPDAAVSASNEARMNVFIGSLLSRLVSRIGMISDRGGDCAERGPGAVRNVTPDKIFRHHASC